MSLLSLRSQPIAAFVALTGDENASAFDTLSISSINEDRLLQILGLRRAERDEIEGLASTVLGQQQVTRALARLAANPPGEVGVMQRRCLLWLLRPVPHGLRFSGANMSPLPGWLSGAQFVALNMSNNDVALQLHFALFSGSGGYILKPPGMRTPAEIGDAPRDSRVSEDESFVSRPFWPPPREHLHRTTIKIISLHNLPKVSFIASAAMWEAAGA